MTVRGLTGIVT